MTNSQFCVQQRQQEQQRLKKLLIAGLAGSTIIHGILAYALARWSFEPPQQAEEPIELILVDKPKPKPKPKIESKPLVEPKPPPIPQPEPVKAKTPPPPVKPPEPAVRPRVGVRRKRTRTETAQTTPPKPTPQKVLTTPSPIPSQPIVSAPLESSSPAPSISSSLNSPTSAVASSETGNQSPGNPGTAVATNSPPPRPDTDNSSKKGISCVSNCEPEYPEALEGVEGNAGIKLTIDPNGNVIDAELIETHSNSDVNREALLAARQMQFSSPGDTSATVRINIDFTVEGSEYDRLAREEQERKEQAEQERKEQEAARQQQLEAQRQARQEQMERERQARQQQESTPPAVNSKPAPLPALSEEELEAERLRRFRERMEQY